MTRVPEDEEREDRIHGRILADAYEPFEQAFGWFYYLESEMAVPFEATCVSERAISPLHEGEAVTVVGMPDETDCLSEMFVQIRWHDRELGVPLAQLEIDDASDATQRAVADWHYWVDRGHQLV